MRELRHPLVSRRTAIQAGAIGLLGLGSDHLAALQAAMPESVGRAHAAIFIFLSGGLAQHDSFDLKPDAPAEIRGEFKPIQSSTPGIQIVEHLPLLAERSHLWALVRSLTHPSNDHSAGHLIMLSGRSELPTGFNPSQPRPSDWPSIAAVAGEATAPRLPRNNLPPAIILPEKLVHNSGRMIPGAFAGQMGRQREPWILEASEFEPRAYGAYPDYEFDHQQRDYQLRRKSFHVSNLTVPENFANRLELVQHIDEQRRDLDEIGRQGGFNRYWEGAVSLLTDPGTRSAFDVSRADPKLLDRYGQNAFGWSLLMARNLIGAGVKLVQVNLGNNETWDTHGNAFPHLKDKLFPPTDRALSALLDDLDQSGQLDSTLIVMAGEFGRTPKISTLPQNYKLPGRDHWGAVQTVFCAGGGIKGGTVVGSSDQIGGHPKSDPWKPENLAATIYSALGIPSTAVWHDAEGRPHNVYYGEPIAGLSR
jgi:hypothetical protein